MNEVVQIKGKMSSREIADVTGKEHKNVKRDIKNQLTQLGISPLSFERTYLDVQNKPQTEYQLDYEQTMILATGYDVKLRQKIIARWAELETSFNKPKSLLEKARDLQNEMIAQIEIEKQNYEDEKKRRQSQQGKHGAFKADRNKKVKVIKTLETKIEKELGFTQDEYEYVKNENKKLSRENKILRTKLNSMEE
jgi:Rha family phage regulatory protein